MDRAREVKQGERRVSEEGSWREVLFSIRAELSSPQKKCAKQESVRKAKGSKSVRLWLQTEVSHRAAVEGEP